MVRRISGGNSIGGGWGSALWSGIQSGIADVRSRENAIRKAMFDMMSEQHKEQVEYAMEGLKQKHAYELQQLKEQSDIYQKQMQEAVTDRRVREAFAGQNMFVRQPRTPEERDQAINMFGQKYIPVGLEEDQRYIESGEVPKGAMAIPRFSPWFTQQGKEVAKTEDDQRYNMKYTRTQLDKISTQVTKLDPNEVKFDPTTFNQLKNEYLRHYEIFKENPYAPKKEIEEYGKKYRQLFPEPIK